ncbi:MAG TPA: peptidoglycan editing factor PgeF [Alphaproteobacteria bacterium]|nr:peptidoglycan editing factor PgeF [Alphaproteobacteria bacterium]
MKYECPHLSKFTSLKHAFFEADPEILLSKRDHAMQTMADRPLPLVTLKQIHSNKVLRVFELWDDKPEGDGLVTNIKGIALGILTADCGPVLFYDPVANVIGACHAGWRGAVGGILQATLDAMEEIGAQRSRIYATLGPTIQQENYEVGPEFPALITEPYDTLFYPSDNKGHHYFNLPQYICLQLRREGLAQIYDIKQNTFSGNFSSRRRYLSEGIKGMSSDNLSAIAIV